MPQETLSIVIPAYNERERILPTLETISSYFASKPVALEVIVVDDGSSDDTAAVVASVGEPVRVISLPGNQGKGAAVRRGVLEAKSRVVLFSDADLSTPIDQWAPFHEKLRDGYDVLVGSRALADSRVERHQPWYRERMGKTFNWILRALLPITIQDTQCGFKMFEAGAAKKLFSASKIDGFAFDAEILFLAERFGMRVAELPVPWFDSVPSRVRPVWHSSGMLRDLIRIRWMASSGVYDVSGDASAAPNAGGQRHS